MNETFMWLSILLSGGMLFVCGWLWSIVFRQQRTGRPHFFSAQSRLKLPIGLVDVVAAVILNLLGQIVGVLIAMIFIGKIITADFEKMPPEQQALIGYCVSVSITVTTALSLLFLYSRYRTVEVVGFNKKTILIDLKLGAVVFFTFVPITFVLQSILTQFWEYKHQTLELISPESSLVTMMSAWLMAVIIAPISEEILFRGIFQGWLARLFGNARPFTERSIVLTLVGGWSEQRHLSDSQPQPQNAPAPDSDMFYIAQSWAPVVLSAVLFGLAHYGQGPAPISIFVFGLGLGLIFRQTGRILPCIVAHFMLNFFSIAMLTLEKVYFASSVSEPGSLAPAAAFWLSWLSWIS